MEEEMREDVTIDSDIPAESPIVIEEEEEGASPIIIEEE